MHNWKSRMMLFEADKGAGGSVPEYETGDSVSVEAVDTEQTSLGWETWLEGQPEDVKRLYGEHTAGLQNALKSERQQRKELSQRLQQVTRQLEEDSKARRLLDEQVDRLNEAEQRAAFFESAVKPEIGCSNPKLAYLAGQDIGALDKQGLVDWNAIRAHFPELFKRQTARGNAGDGAGSEPLQGKKSMNVYIRQAAGR